MRSKLLTRSEFNKSVLKRDKNKCVVCNSKAKIVHKVINTDCWIDGGWYLENGVSLCDDCAKDAEFGIIDCDTLRRYAHIETLLPSHFDQSETYDRWGKIVDDPLPYIGVL